MMTVIGPLTRNFSAFQMLCRHRHSVCYAVLAVMPMLFPRALSAGVDGLRLSA